MKNHYEMKLPDLQTDWHIKQYCQSFDSIGECWMGIMFITPNININQIDHTYRKDVINTTKYVSWKGLYMSI